MLFVYVCMCVQGHARRRSGLAKKEVCCIGNCEKFAKARSQVAAVPHKFPSDRVASGPTHEVHFLSRGEFTISLLYFLLPQVHLELDDSQRRDNPPLSSLALFSVEYFSDRISYPGRKMKTGEKNSRGAQDKDVCWHA